MIQSMNGQDLNKLAKSEHDELILDVRTSNEFRQGHLPGAMNIDVQSLPAHLDDLRPYQDKPIILYCRSGARAEMAAQYLEQVGFKNLLLAPGVAYYRYDLVKEPKEKGGFNWGGLFSCG